MTITTTQLDELEAKTRALIDAPLKFNATQSGTGDERSAELTWRRAAEIFRDAMTPAAALQLIAIARAALALDYAAVLAMLSEELGEYGLHTGGSYGVELDYSDKYKILETVAGRIVTALKGTR